MKVRAAKAMSVVSAALLMTAGGAAVAQAAPAEGGPGSRGDASVRACQNIGGGTWCQGSVVGTGGLEECYSNYVHPSNYHGSTAIMGDVVSRGYANAGYWSYASVTGGWAYTCYTYYNSNA